MDLSALMQTMVLLFATIAAGYAAVKLKLVDDNFSRSLSRLILFLLQVCMVLGSVLRTEHLLTNPQVLALTAIAIGCYVLLIAGALGIAKLLRVPQNDRGTYQFLFVLSNVGFIGYPVVDALFGTNARFYVTIFILIFQLVAFTYGVFLMSGDRKHIRISKELLKKPVVVASVFAYLFYLTGLSAPQLLADTVSYVGNLTTPTSMLVIGCSLALVPIRSVFCNWRLYALLAVKMVLVPLLCYVVLQPVLHNELLLGIVVVMMAMPCATNATMLSVEYGGNTPLASSGIFLSTVLSIGTIPAIMWLLFVH